jgi:hypothetical protein
MPLGKSPQRHNEKMVINLSLTFSQSLGIFFWILSTKIKTSGTMVDCELMGVV